MQKADSIIIVGTGTFGLSTAWHLAQRGYTNITCLDPYLVPSKLSAGNDISKAIRTQYKDPLYAKLAHESLAEWKSPLFAQVFHQSGMAYLKSSLFETDLDVSNMASDLGRTFKDVGKYGDDSKVRFLADGDAVKEACNISAATDVSSLSGWIDGNNGWANAAGGLKVVAEEARKLGVRFESGPRATMRELLRNEDGVAYGVVAKDGTEWKADKVLLATGGWSDSLLDFEGQLLSGGYSITHIDLTQEEADRYRDIPVIAIDSVGFVFPPNQDNILKVCDLDPVKTNLRKLPGRDGLVSVPDSKAYEGGRTHTLPQRDFEQSRALLKYLLPEFVNHPCSFSRLCWDTQSFDGGWIIGAHPSSPSSLILATGGSGHTYKNLPCVGRYVADAMEDKLSAELKDVWRWRPDRVQGQVPLSLYNLGDEPPKPKL